MGLRVPKARLRDRQPFFTVETEQLLVVHVKSLSSKQDAQTAIPEPASFIRQFAQPLTQRIIAPILLSILKDRPVQISQLARPTLRQAVPIHHVRHSPALHVSGMVLGPMAASCRTVSNFLSRDP